MEKDALEHEIYQDLLLEAGILLTSSLDIDAILAAIANLTLRGLAEWCSLDVITDSEVLEKLAIAHVDPAKIEWAREFGRKYPPDLTADSRLGAVLRTGETLFVSEIDEAMLRHSARSAEHLADMRQIGVGSVIICAFKKGERILGMMTLIHSQRGRFGKREVAFAEELARRSALAIDNARLYATVRSELADRQRIERELGASEERFRELANAMPVIVWVSKGSEGIIFTNHHYHEYTGIGIEGRGLGGWSRVVHPDDREEAFARYAEAVNRNMPWEHELRLRRCDGEYRWHLSRCVPILDDLGEARWWYGTSTDIHEQKIFSEELERQVHERTAELVEALRRAENFDYSIAHDLRAPLRAIISTSSILSRELEETLSPEHLQLLHRQVSRGLKLSSLVDDLLLLSRTARAKPHVEEVSLSGIAHEALRKLGATPSQTQRFEIERDLVSFADHDLIELLLRSLFANAIKFASGGIIRFGRREQEFFVSDEGPGFDPQYAEKVFLPFHRLVVEDDYPGNGTGLTLAKEVVERHQGQIRIDSNPQAGTTVFFSLLIGYKGIHGTEIHQR